MVRNRLITILTINNGVLFRTRNFIPDYRYTLNFVDAWSIDEIVILDITREKKKGKGKFYSTVENFATNCFVPLSVGGGVSCVEDFSRLLNLGADKVTLNTQAVEQPELITNAAKKFGSQCLVVSIDAKKINDSKYEVFTEFGTKSTGLCPKEWAKQAEDLGAGEILITAIDKDGSLEGYDDELNCLVSEGVNVPVLVAGGAGKWQDFVDGIRIGKASAVCTTNIYHFTENSISSAKQFMKQNNIHVRV